ncbi:hypothetical protein P175DRAFT_0544172 [Aspergillus ochraceoroseus IBT 24754]|uniref:Uncharacterized protein n=1 Tax=Aspergillus ochraceoroseus IBT 24754 TaxID=1392256 RepID=A0A2T5M526_9EURO|nr:uncharacterized protein P175DRAFT_0544172 [Aspergillus ochraceoroseus IBT 24754]PTU23640.1 hypothetical protein P175DRAFT_0544172 [Aspergillus ochraceoroseus IBT 24754]
MPSPAGWDITLMEDGSFSARMSAASRLYSSFGIDSCCMVCQREKRTHPSQACHSFALWLGLGLLCLLQRVKRTRCREPLESSWGNSANYTFGISIPKDPHDVTFIYLVLGDIPGSW